MNFKFKKHQIVKLLLDPDPEYIEYNSEDDEIKEIPIKKGMLARINMMLSNGQYHLEILNPKNKDEIIAYAPMSEEYLELAEE